MGETSTQNELLIKIEENEDLKKQYAALQRNYDGLQSNYDEMFKRLSDLEALSQISSQSHNVSNTYYPPENNLTDDPALHIPPNRNNSISSEISQMKGEALNASSSIRDLQNVFSYV